MEFNEHQLQLVGYFKDQNVEVVMFPEDTKRRFRSLNSFYDFVVQEKDFWSPFINNEARAIKNHFDNMYAAFDNALSQTEHSQAVQYLTRVIESSKQSGWPAVYSNTRAAKKIKELYQQSPNKADSFIWYVFRNTINLSSTEHFNGLMHGFTFNNDLSSIFTSEIAAAEESVVHVKQRYLNDLDNLHTEYMKKSEERDSVATEFQTSTESWRCQTKTDVEEFLANKQKQYEELERTYQEKLRLESPAKYWSDLSKEYEDRGNVWRKWALWTAVVFVALLTLLLYTHPDSLFVTNGKFNLNSLKSTLVFMLITSTSVYIIHLFIKLSISSYHLSRDAKERFQLTHVYLSLINEAGEKGIQDADRAIILQSIFSRSDTGLLKGDSTPSMSDISSILKSLNKT